MGYSIDGKGNSATLERELWGYMKRLSTFMLLPLGLAIILAGVIMVRNGLNPSTEKLNLPLSLVGQSITNSLHGDQAIMEISRLHRNPFPLTSAAIGYYGEQEPIILWVSDTKNQNTAAMLVTDMHDAIATGNTPFSPVGEAAIDGRSVNELSGMGQRHFYFQSDSRVIWLAADPGMADEALLQVMEFYP